MTEIVIFLSNGNQIKAKVRTTDVAAALEEYRTKGVSEAADGVTRIYLPHRIDGITVREIKA